MKKSTIVTIDGDFPCYVSHYQRVYTMPKSWIPLELMGKPTSDPPPLQTSWKHYLYGLAMM